MDKPTVLVFVASYLPGNKSGGPVRTIANMVEILGDTFDFRIITADRDLGDPDPYSSVVADSWNRVGKADVFYVSPSRQSLRQFVLLMRQTPHDVVYLNSFFDPVFTQRPLWARFLRLVPQRKLILAPRGEFSRGALGLKSWKKRPYIALVQAIGLYRVTTWQASSASEAEDIRREFLSESQDIGIAPQIAVAPDLSVPVDRNQPAVPIHPHQGPLRIVFLSRIARMKNLDFILRVLANVTGPVQLSIYGAVEDHPYWRRCEELIEALGANVSVTYGGLISHDRVVETLSTHDLFFLPSLGENYGHVIFEALAAGLPVLISDQTPWRDLAELGVGWDVPLTDMPRFIAVIEAQAKLEPAECAAQRLRAKEYARSIASNDEIVSRNVALFRDCMTK